MQDLKTKLEAAYKSIQWHDCELCHEQYTATGWHCTACGHHSESWCATCRRFPSTRSSGRRARSGDADMCGIAGLVAPERVTDADCRLVAAMTRALAHRGPDAEGLVDDGPVALGNRRLAIIDPSGGGQPMTTPSSGKPLVR